MKLLYSSLLFLFFLFNSLNTAFASHVPGGNITYQCVGANQFLVTLTLFEDCGTAFEANGTQTLQVTNSCGITGLTSITLANTIYQQEVSQLCPALIGNSECNGGTLPGIYMHQWQTLVTIPAQCNSWTFSYASCCRNTTNNLNGTPAYYWETTLNNAAAPCNNSPTVTTQMIPYVCVNQPVVYNLGIYEPDGHSLSYSLINAFSASGTPVVYTAPFSGASPITGATINSNGNISFTATVTGNYVFSVLVEEYNSNGVLVGSIIQDFQFEVINCPANTNPVVPSGIINYTGDGTVIAPNEIELCIGDSFCFELEFTDLNSNDSIFIASNIGLALPGATVTQLTFQSPAIAQVCWTATASVPANNTVVFNAKDNACPMFGITFYPIKVNVIQSTYAGPDQTLCAGDDAIINVTGGSVFNWSVLPGGDTILIGNNFNCNPCANVIASPSVTTTYVVTSDLTIGCGNIDTVTINVVDDFTYTLTQSSNAGCINDNIYFSSITNPPGAYQYTWSPSTFLNSTTIANPIVTPTSPGVIDYAVQILGPTGCTKYDTLSINVAASFKPDVTLMVSPTNIVCGDSVFLDVQLNGGSPASCGPSLSNACVSPSTQYIIGTATGVNTTTTYPAPFANWYRNAKHQFLFTAAELNAMGITAGKLTEIAWQVVQINGTINYNQYTVKLGCTSQTALTNTWVSGLTTVFTPQNIVITTGWNTLPFTTAYEWDGLSNIVVEICYNNLATNFTQNSITPFTTTAFNSSAFYFSDATPACPSLTASAGSPSPNRPVTRFGFCPTLPDPVNYTFQWTPTSSIDDPTAQTTFALPQNNTTFQLVTTFINGGCIDTSSVNVTVDCCETPLINSTNITCFGGNNGQIEVTPISTTLPPYTVQLIDPISSAVLQSNTNVMSSVTFSSLIAGNYLVSTIDANGCIADTLVSLSEPNLLSISISNDTAICIGDSVQLSAFGGAIYSWSPITNLSNPTNANTWYTGTSTQLFTVLVTDTNGCSNTDSVLITVNSLPTISLSNDTTICENDTIQLLASGGVNYTWSPTTTLSNTTISNPVAFPTTSTTYQVVVTNSFGCKDSASVSLIVQTLPNIVASSDVSICIGDTTQLNASGALNYTWQPVMNISNNLISNPLAWPTTTTEYIVLGEDALGCINSDSVTITVNTLPTIYAGLDVWLCPGSDIQLTAIGTGNFSWTPTIGLTDPTISNPFASPLDTTNYIVEITDNNGCKNSDSIFVFVSPKVPTNAGLSQTICEGNTLVIGGNPTSVPGTIFSWTPTSLIVNATLSNPTVLPTVDTWFIVHTSNDTCNGVDSVLVQVNPYPLANAGNDIQICIGDSVQLNATGGVDFTWLPNQDISNATINNPTVWPSDTTQYIVTVTDNNGCVQSDSVWIIVNPLPSLFAGNDEIICINDSIQLNAIGTGNFSWSPTNFMTDNTLSNPIVFPILNTTYSVVLTDSNGCVNSDSLLVTVNNLPPVNAGIDVSICFNDSIQLQASGAVNYNWTLADGLVNTNISNPFVSPNSTIQYIVFGTDANLCTNSDTVQVTVFNLPIINAGNDVQICIFDTTQLTANGGVSYTWSPNNGLSSISVSNPFANPTATQEYIVEGVDTNNCFNSDTIVVTVVPLPVANAGVDVKICLGDTIQLTATGGIVYNWSPSATLTNSNTDVTNAFPDTSTQYIVTVTDVNTCINFDTVVVEVFRISTINDTTICLLDSAQLDVFGAPGVLFSWTPVDYLSDPTIANPIAKPIENTTYTVSVTDIDGCQDQASVTITVNEIPKPLFSYMVEPGCEELIVHFKDSSSHTDTYSWNFGNGASSDETNPTMTFVYNQQYDVELVASNNFGCTAAYVTTLTAEDFEVYYSIYIPNVFTPNGDGENDAFFIDVPGKLYDCLDFRIYNRWGQLIYKSVGDALNWDGRSFYGDTMPEGTYFFTVEIKDKQYSGTINLFR